MIAAPAICGGVIAVVSACCCQPLAPGVRIDTSPPALSGPQLYVAPTGTDSGQCSSSEPCRELERADALATPGTTINIAPGTYAPAALKASGTRDARIRFVSTQRWAASVRNTNRSEGPILLSQGEYVDIAGLEVTSDVPTAVDGIVLAGSHSRAIGNLVAELDRPCAPNGGIIAGDAEYAARDIAIIGNYVHDIGTGERDRTCSLLHGIYAAVPGVVIANNIVVRALGDGITSWHAAARLTVVNNTIVGNGHDGILIGNGDQGATAEGNTGSYVANNVIAANAGDAISEGGAHPVRNTYLANTFYGNGRDRLDQWGGSREGGTSTGDPLLADDFRPRPGSPLLWTGTPLRAPTTDFAGAPRGLDITRGAFQEPAP